MLLLSCRSFSRSLPLSSSTVSAHRTPSPTACSFLSAKRESLEQPALRCTCAKNTALSHTGLHAHRHHYRGCSGVDGGMLIQKMHSEIHGEPQSHTELTVHAQTHSQPEPISVHNVHSLDELTSVVTSIDTAHSLIYHTLFLVCAREWVCVWKKRKKERSLQS